MKTCSETNCTKKHLAKGLCQFHYQKLYRQTEIGKQKIKIWNKSKGQQIASYKFNHSEHGRKIKTFYENYRNHLKANATPKWLSKEQKKQIKNIYLNCPKGHHVDHILPINGKDVCGLHVPWNLQILPAEVNIRKSNKF